MECPECGSTDIIYIGTGEKNIPEGKIVTIDFFCKNCRFTFGVEPRKYMIFPYKEQ